MNNSRLSTWKIIFLIFLMVASIYLIRNNQTKTQQEKAAKNWQRVDEKGKPYTSATIGDEYINSKGAVFGTFYSITRSVAVVPLLNITKLGICLGNFFFLVFYNYI